MDKNGEKNNESRGPYKENLFTRSIKVGYE